MEGGNSKNLARQAHAEGVANLRESALKKAMQGKISLDEVDRISYQ
jgi:type IV pilus assembly protein PilB